MLRGDRFRVLRENKGYTHEELAELLELGTTQIWRYETGKTDPSADILARISQVLEVSSDYLLGLTDDPNPNLKIDNLTTQERKVLAAMRHGDVVEAMRALLSAET